MSGGQGRRTGVTTPGDADEVMSSGPVTSVISWYFWQFFPLQCPKVPPLCNHNSVSFLSLQDFQKSSPGCVPAVRKAFQQLKDLFLSGGKEMIALQMASQGLAANSCSHVEKS